MLRFTCRYVHGDWSVIPGLCGLPVTGHIKNQDT